MLSSSMMGRRASYSVAGRFSGPSSPRHFSAMMSCARPACPSCSKPPCHSCISISASAGTHCAHQGIPAVAANCWWLFAPLWQEQGDSCKHI